ncbi:MAG: hypothetical protein HWQ38_24070 [Nostoc sp. NMS7]|uniref:hypothetical protein n=1 Tax=Nostoc sp. NMS7 TaxID=2815391 RepID=UPI0025F94067|nr:hypothetical protein [Nostoc sp. NMS7]MBN3949370.1 hypothetical protein [Nostoc sp. NMS7]
MSKLSKIKKRRKLSLLANKESAKTKDTPLNHSSGNTRLHSDIPDILKSSHKIISIFDAAKMFFAKFGRGMILYNKPMLPFGYVLLTNKDLTDLDRSIIKDYNPNKEFYMSGRLDDDTNSMIYISSIYTEKDKEAKLRVLIPKNEGFEFSESQVFR